MVDLSKLSPTPKRIALAALKAIDDKVVLQLDYSGWTRLVEVHTVGVSSAGNPIIRAYQLTGGAESGQHAGWKLFDLDKIPETYKITDIPSEAPRPGYKKGDSAFLDIFREV